MGHYTRVGDPRFRKWVELPNGKLRGDCRGIAGGRGEPSPENRGDGRRQRGNAPIRSQGRVRHCKAARSVETGFRMPMRFGNWWPIWFMVWWVRWQCSVAIDLSTFIVFGLLFFFA